MSLTKFYRFARFSTTEVLNIYFKKIVLTKNEINLHISLERKKVNILPIAENVSSNIQKKSSNISSSFLLALSADILILVPFLSNAYFVQVT